MSRILRKNKLHLYHISVLQELSQNDFNIRIQFFTWAQNKLLDPNFFRFVLWSNEATFKSEGINRYNLHYWSEVNSHWMRTVDHQYQWNINVWAGIIGIRLIGSFFFEESLTIERFVRFLRNDFPDLMEDVPLRDGTRMWFNYMVYHFTLV